MICLAPQARPASRESLTLRSSRQKVRSSVVGSAGLIGPGPILTSGMLAGGISCAIEIADWARGSACADAGQILTKSPPGPNWHNGISLI